MHKVLCLTGTIAMAAFFSIGVRAEPQSRISGPHVHENLAVYFIHGTSANGPVPLTLAEALERKQARVIETGNVNALKVENLGDEAIFIQSGDIVKGGQQDRVLTVSLLLPKGSGQVAIDSFCVEAGRWAARGTEDVKQFSSSGYALPSREAKLAMRMPSKPQAEPVQERDLATTRSAGIDSTSQRRLGAIARPQNDTSERQRKMWSEVARMQDKLSASLGARVTEAQSATSLQLSLENEKLKAARAAYMAAFEKLPAGQSDIVGFVFATDGRINSADVYPSNGLFQKMWSKLLTASITEAVSTRGAKNAANASPAPDVAAVAAFIQKAEAGTVHEQTIGGLMKQDTRDADGALFVETRAATAAGAPKSAFVHRNYLAK